MSQEANVLQRVPYPAWLMGSHAWVETSGWMAHVTILSISQWLPAEEEKISNFMDNTRATLNFQERLLLRMSYPGVWHVHFGSRVICLFTGLGLLSWVRLARDSLGLEPWRMAVERTSSWSFAWWLRIQKSQKGPHSFIDPSRLSRNGNLVLSVTFLYVINTRHK